MSGSSAWIFPGQGSQSVGMGAAILAASPAASYLSPIFRRQKEFSMSDTPYTPPKVWTWNKASGGRFANINRPIAGPTHDQELPVGKHPMQLYSLGTPNGQKVTIMLEELLALGHKGAEYDAWLVKIGEGDQFGSGFVAINPNSKIPALLDRRSDPPLHLFESGSILIHLAESFGANVRLEIKILSMLARKGRILEGEFRSAARAWADPNFGQPSARLRLVPRNDPRAALCKCGRR